jgi:hypothetical protein
MMNLRTTILSCALLSAIVCVPAGAQVTGDPDSEVEHLKSSLAVYQTNLSAAKTKFDHARAQVEAGTLRTTALAGLEADLKVAEVQHEQAKRDLTRAQGAQSFARPVDVHLKDATVRQAADVLSKVSNIPIEVDKSVSNDLRITVDAQGIPLATVLEVVAEQAKLQIGKGSPGVVLRTWPRLEVNGSSKVYTGPNAPWSDEWGTGNALAFGGLSSGQRWHSFFGSNTLRGYITPTQSLMNSLNGYATTNKANTIQKPATSLAPQYSSRPLTTWTAAPTASALLNITGVGDRLVIAEAGAGPKGEAGYWLTVYRLSGSELIRVASTFHASPAPRRTSNSSYQGLYYNNAVKTLTANPAYPAITSMTRPQKPAKR